MKNFEEYISKETLYEMTNMKPKRTGLDYDVWIPDTPSDGKRGVHGKEYVKIYKGTKFLGKMDIRTSKVLGYLNISTKDLKMIQRFLELNREILIAHVTDPDSDAADLFNNLKPV